MPLNKIQYTDSVTVIPADNLNEIQDEIIDIRTAYDGTVYESAGDAVRGQVSDLGEHTILEPITLSGYYVDDGAFIGTRANSVVYLYDISDFDLNAIKVRISGTHNRCRILLTTAEISSVASGTRGTYIDKGNSTSEFSLPADDLTGYKTLALCTNFSATPYADVVMTKVGAVDAYMRRYMDEILGDLDAKDGIIKDILFTLIRQPTDPYLTTGGNMKPNNRIKYARFPIAVGDVILLEPKMTSNSFDIKFDIEIYSAETGGTRLTATGWLSPIESTYISEYDGYALVTVAPTSDSDVFSDATDCDGCVYFFKKGEIEELGNEIEELDLEADRSIVPVLRDGSIGNSGNANAVTMTYIMPIENKYDNLYVEFSDSEDADKYAFFYCFFRNATDGMSTSAAVTDSSITEKNFNDNWDDTTTQPYIRISVADMSGYDHISIGIARMSQDGTRIPIRIATDQYCLRMKWEYTSESESDALNTRDVNVNEAIAKTNNARHIKGNNGTPLTLLHFSDLHSDTNVLARIMEEAEVYEANIDDAICTGDIVGNTAEQITSWWDADVLTCIGNHDSASYNASTGYNWTALSMADRDAYYIAPFESNWGITHTSGTSYYYKDYSASNVRLIVMDAMLYSSYESDTSLGTAQTAWLENLLADAITNDLHVLIAIHAPHPDSVAKECSFSRYGQTAMPTESDCNTPQVVIDTVATKINAGLNFVGYIVGHTHQDNIWDAEGDGTQLMYCVTCAAVAQQAQWEQSDQHRSAELDAYNLVTIDTTNTLVKLVRGGGADIDDHMRTRKAICINYSTGAIVGEVL